jgi:hypothetical protein
MGTFELVQVFGLVCRNTLVLFADWKRVSSDLSAAASLSIFSAHLLDSLLDSLQPGLEASRGLVSSETTSIPPGSLDSTQLVDIPLLDGAKSSGSVSKHTASTPAVGESPAKGVSNEGDARLKAGSCTSANFRAEVLAHFQKVLAYSVQISATLRSSHVRLSWLNMFKQLYMIVSSALI